MLFDWQRHVWYWNKMLTSPWTLPKVVVETLVTLWETKAGKLREDIFVAKTLRRFERKTKIFENCRINCGKHMTKELSNWRSIFRSCISIYLLHFVKMDTSFLFKWITIRGFRFGLSYLIFLPWHFWLEYILGKNVNNMQQYGIV